MSKRKRTKTKAVKVAKFDDIQIRNGALEQDGRRVAAQLQKMRDYEATAYEKAGHELRKMDDFWDSLTQTLVEVKAKCRGTGFKAFREKWCPDLGRSRLYRLLQIGRGDKTLEEARAEDVKRKAKSREKAVRDKANVTDSPGPKLLLLGTGEVVESPATVPEPTAEESAEQSTENPDLALTPDEKAAKHSAYCLAQFNFACGQWLPGMSEADIKLASHYFYEGRWKPRGKAKEAGRRL